MDSSETNKRNEYIDWLKGFAIFLVVLGHCWTIDKEIFWLIYRFHMPLFFCISGYLFNNRRKFKDFLKIKIKTLILPYIVFFIISYLITYFCVKHVSMENSLKAFFFNGRYLTKVNNWAIWYLPLFFIQSILFYFVTKINNNIVFDVIICLFAILTVPTYSIIAKYTVKGYIPFSIQVIPPAMVYMGIGQIFKKVNKKIPSINNKYFTLASFALFIAGIVLSINNEDQIISISSYRYVIAALLIIQFIITVTKDNKNKVMIYLGKNSLIILGLHRILIKVMEVCKFDEILERYNITGTMAAIIICIICIVVICIINETYKYIKNNYKKIFIIKDLIAKHIKLGKN